ncbi:hypothetical protein D3C85_1358800 [compost metagenome]
MSARKAYSPSQHYMDRFLKAHTAAKARAEKRRAEELVKQQEQQVIAQHAQQVVQQLSDLTSQVNAITKPSDEVTGDAITSLDRNEQYRTTIIQKMINHIHGKRN